MLDFIEGLPRSDGYNAILVVVDRLSKDTDFIALKHPFSTVEIAEAFLKEASPWHSLVSHFRSRSHIFGGSCLNSKDPLLN